MTVAPEQAPAWRPDQGDPATVRGTVAAIDWYDGNRYGGYWVITLDTDGGRRVAWHAQGTVARRELERADPVLGERLQVTWHGRPDGKAYTVWAVRNLSPRKVLWDSEGRSLPLVPMIPLVSDGAVEHRGLQQGGRRGDGPAT